MVIIKIMVNDRTRNSVRATIPDSIRWTTVLTPLGRVFHTGEVKGLLHGSGVSTSRNGFRQAHPDTEVSVRLQTHGPVTRTTMGPESTIPGSRGHSGL